MLANQTVFKRLISVGEPGGLSRVVLATLMDTPIEGFDSGSE
jgi:hypothetical protein